MGDVVVGEVVGHGPRHLVAEVGQVEAVEASVEDTLGVVHLAVAHEVHHGAVGCGGHESIVANDSAAADAAAGIAASTRSTAASSCAPLTNHDSNALGGR